MAKLGAATVNSKGAVSPTPRGHRQQVAAHEPGQRTRGMTTERPPGTRRAPSATPASHRSTATVRMASSFGPDHDRHHQHGEGERGRQVGEVVQGAHQESVGEDPDDDRGHAGEQVGPEAGWRPPGVRGARAGKGPHEHRPAPPSRAAKPTIFGAAGDGRRDPAAGDPFGHRGMGEEAERQAGQATFGGVVHQGHERREPDRGAEGAQGTARACPRRRRRLRLRLGGRLYDRAPASRGCPVRVGPLPRLVGPAAPVSCASPGARSWPPPPCGSGAPGPCPSAGPGRRR